jgi:hypothetical protein
MSYIEYPQLILYTCVVPRKKAKGKNGKYHTVGKCTNLIEKLQKGATSTPQYTYK